MTKRLLAVLLLLVAITVGHAGEKLAVSVSTTIHEGDKKGDCVLDPLSFMPGVKATANSGKIQAFATEFEKPQKTKITSGLYTGQNAYIPFTPRGFTSVNDAWRIEYEATLDKDLIVLVCTATYNTVDSYTNAAYGEYAGPIYETINGKKFLACQNKSISSTVNSSKTYFQIFAKPGKSYTVRLKQFDRWINATITCNLIKPIPTETQISMAR